VPSDSHLKVAYDSDRDIGVNVGQQAEVMVDTFNFTRYGLLRGTVVSVSQDAIVREKPNQDTQKKKADGALSDTSEPDGQEFLYST
jgi:hemolysin D